MTMLHVRALMVLLALLMVVVRPASAQKPEPSVVPGVGVGNVRLGMTGAQVRRLTGKPTRTGIRRPGVREETWIAKAPVESQADYFLTVLYENGRVVQIDFNAPRYVTADGLSVLKTLAQFRRRYPNATRREYYHRDTDSEGGYRSVVYDATDQGIAFSLSTQDEMLESYKPTEIRIHRRGRPAIPDARAVRDDPKPQPKQNNG